MAIVLSGVRSAAWATNERRAAVGAPIAQGGARSAAAVAGKPIGAGADRKPFVVAFWVAVGLTTSVLAALGAELALAYRTTAVAAAGWEAEANAALIDRFYADVWNGGRSASVAGLVAADHAYHDPTFPAEAAGPSGVVEAVGGLRRAFPDLALTVDDVVVQGDRVAVRFTARGTHRGPILGAAATGARLTVTGAAVHRLARGQIAETWMTWDAHGLAEQVGLVLLPAAAADGWEGAPEREQPFGPY